MLKRSITILMVVFCVTFPGSGEDGVCFGGDDLSAPTLSLEANGGSIPTGPTFDGFHGVRLPSAFLNGENGGGGQVQGSIGRLTMLVRLLGVRPNFIPERFLHSDDLRSWFGPVRPHLYLRRLLI